MLQNLRCYILASYLAHIESPITPPVLITDPRAAIVFQPMARVNAACTKTNPLRQTVQLPKKITLFRILVPTMYVCTLVSEL